MKILFLDADGVLNHKETFTKDAEAHMPIDAYCAFLVGRIEMNTGCKVVLSSSWRHHPESVAYLEKRLAIKFLDKTPNLPMPRVRGDEIKAWLDAHPEVTKYAILDDDDDMLPEQMPNFFQTSFKDGGLTTEISEKVLTHFRNNRESR